MNVINHLKFTITIKDVPVDAFWPISLYNKEGYFQENDYNAYSVNNITGTPQQGWFLYRSFW